MNSSVASAHSSSNPTLWTNGLAGPCAFNTNMKKSFYDAHELEVSDLAEICAQTASRTDYPNCCEIVANVVVYDGATARRLADTSPGSRELMSEVAYCLKDGPGVLVVRNAYADVSVVERSTDVLRQIVESEQSTGEIRGDHFGDNERLWNSLQKACLVDPDLFIDYYGSPILRLACEAWLGPHYRVTAQMNNVKPGGSAQRAHRDYHLGFQSAETVARFPAHAQQMSQFLTLQGAIAHVDMPLESGPTLLLPYSQQYAGGYMAYQRSEFATFFEENRVQLGVAKGDMLFFNPAVFHAGGRNSTNSDRVANLLQVSSAFGRTMETINHRMMIEAVYPALQVRLQTGASEKEIKAIIAVVADGYSFPTNLDSDPPVGGNAPRTQQQIVWELLQNEIPLDAAGRVLEDYDVRRSA